MTISDVLAFDRKVEQLAGELGTIGVDGAQLTVLDAPIGYGKESLIQRWLDVSPSLVRVLRRRISDTAELRDLLASMEQLVRGEGQELEMDSDPDAPQNPILVIVDNDLDAASLNQIWKLNELLLANENLYVVVISRRSTQASTWVVSAQVPVCYLGTDQLRLSAPDISALAAAHGVILARQVFEFVTGFDGWPLVAQWAVEQADRSGSTAGHQSVLELSRRVLELAGSRFGRRVITGISICPGVDSQFLEDFFGQSRTEVREVLDRLLSLGLLEREEGGDSVGLQVPSALRPGFEKLASLWWSGEETVALKEAFASYVSETHPVRAAKMYAELRLYAGLDELLRRGLARILYFDSDLDRLITQLPYEEVADFPRILGYQVKVGQTSSYLSSAGVRVAAARVAELIPAEAVADPERSVIDLGLVVMAARVINDHVRLTEMANAAERHLAVADVAGNLGEHATLNFAYGELADAYLVLQEHQKALYVGQRAAEVAKDGELTIRQAHALLRLALLSALNGEVAETRDLLAQAAILVRECGTDMPGHFWCKGWVAELLIGHAINDRAHLQRALARLQENQDMVVLPSYFFLAESAYLRWRDGNESAYRQLELRMEGDLAWRLSPPSRSMMNTRLAGLAMYGGDYVRAEEILDSEEGATNRYTLNTRATLRLLRGDPLRALQLIWSGGPIFGTDRAADEASILAAVCYYVAGEVDQAVNLFKNLVMMEPKYFSWFWFTSIPFQPLRELAEIAAERGEPNLVPVIDEMPENYRISYHEPLTRSELNLLEKLEEGATIATSADELFISPNTAKSHLRRIYKKLGVSGRDVALAMARRMYRF